MKAILYILLFFCFSCSTGKENKLQSVNNMVIEDTIPKFIDLKSDIQRVLNIKQSELVGEIKTSSNLWFLIKGEISEPTYEDLALFIYPAIKEGIPDSILTTKYSFPGKEHSFDNQLVYESRVFYGDCTSKFKKSILWYQHELKDSLWDTSYFIISLDNVGLNYVSDTLNNSYIQEVLSNVTNGVCFEVPGIDQYDEP